MFIIFFLIFKHCSRFGTFLQQKTLLVPFLKKSTFLQIFSEFGNLGLIV